MFINFARQLPAGHEGCISQGTAPLHLGGKVTLLIPLVTCAGNDMEEARVDRISNSFQ